MTEKHRRYRERFPERVRADQASRAARYSARSPEEVAAARRRIRPDGLKRCPTCLTDRPLGHFFSNSSRVDGLAAVCRVCCLRELAARTTGRPSPP